MESQESSPPYSRGGVFAVIGIDGAGKSSIIEALHDMLTSAGIPVDKRWCGFHDWRFFAFVPKSVKKQSKGKDRILARTPEEEYYSSRERLPSNIARLVYYFAVSLEYVLQMTVDVALPRREGRILLCDRYFMDQTISYSAEMKSDMAQRFFMWFFSFLLPRPDLVIVILVSPTTALSRKRDIPNEEYLAERYKRYQALAKQYGYEVLDGELPIGENVARIAGMVTDSMGVAR